MFHLIFIGDIERYDLFGLNQVSRYLFYVGP